MFYAARSNEFEMFHRMILNSCMIFMFCVPSWRATKNVLVIWRNFSGEKYAGHVQTPRNVVTKRRNRLCTVTKQSEASVPDPCRAYFPPPYRPIFAKLPEHFLLLIMGGTQNMNIVYGSRVTLYMAIGAVSNEYVIHSNSVVFFYFIFSEFYFFTI